MTTRDVLMRAATKSGEPITFSKARSLEMDDLPSTAASSAMHSPYGGPNDAPKGPDLDAVDWAASTTSWCAQSALASPRAAPAHEFVPEIDVADEDLTIAASIEPRPPTRRASKEGSPWPCTEWLTAEPYVAEPCLEWLLTDTPFAPRACPAACREQPSRRRRRRHVKPAGRGSASQGCLPAGEKDRRGSFRPKAAMGNQPFLIGFDSENGMGSESPTSTAWLRESDDAYPSAAGNLLQW